MATKTKDAYVDRKIKSLSKPAPEDGKTKSKPIKRFLGAIAAFAMIVTTLAPLAYTSIKSWHEGPQVVMTSDQIQK